MVAVIVSYSGYPLTAWVAIVDNSSHPTNLIVGYSGYPTNFIVGYSSHLINLKQISANRMALPPSGMNRYFSLCIPSSPLNRLLCCNKGIRDSYFGAVMVSLAKREGERTIKFVEWASWLKPLQSTYSSSSQFKPAWSAWLGLAWLGLARLDLA